MTRTFMLAATLLAFVVDGRFRADQHDRCRRIPSRMQKTLLWRRVMASGQHGSISICLRPTSRRQLRRRSQSNRLGLIFRA